MTTLTERGMGLLARALPVAAGGTIVYARGTSRVSIEAGFGVSEFQTDTAGSVLIEHTDRDFIFPAASLILGGTLATPQRGDQITVVDESKVFEVLAPGGAQVYRPCDPQGIAIRVHGKRLT